MCVATNCVEVTLIEDEATIPCTCSADEFVALKPPCESVDDTMFNEVEIKAPLMITELQGRRRSGHHTLLVTLTNVTLLFCSVEPSDTAARLV